MHTALTQTSPAAPSTLHVAFAKYHGLGNDFVVVDARSQDGVRGWTQEQWGRFAKRACDRRMGIGADGVLVVDTPAGQHAVARMRVFNSDGTDGGMCGNGIRCVAHMLAAQQLAHGDALGPMVIEAGGSMKRVEVVGALTPANALVAVDMGSAEVRLLQEDAAEVVSECAQDIAAACGAGARASMVDVGNPHLVLHVARLPNVAQLAELGPKLEHHPRFPNRTNVQFAMHGQHDASLLHVCTWERGSGITQACGTGACAVAASVAAESAEQTFRVMLPGGELVIVVQDVERGFGWQVVRGLVMTGPAQLVFAGQVNAQEA